MPEHARRMDGRHRGRGFASLVVCVKSSLFNGVRVAAMGGFPFLLFEKVG